MKSCISELTTRFLAGELTASESVEFENHLEVCPRCVEQLEREAGGDVGWQSARELLVHTQTEHWVSADVSSNRSRVDSEWMPACTSSTILSILAPTDDPEFVGRIGAYEISGVVGRGSAGIVLRGFDRALHRNVAIKVLDPSMADVGAARQRFAREAKAMAAISHENVVAVYEVSEHAGVPYFVMEYVPGGSLERRLRSCGPFDPTSIVRIGLQVAQALAAAHTHGLVHRDIKPGNILLDRGTERVRVADFGLVRVANDVSCTRSGFIAGTPQYMAPEQVKAEVCDGRSDLFSLGSVLYALCTGHAPFRADTIYGVLQRIVSDEPRSIRESNPQIPEWLDDFIGRLMSKHRDERFGSADEVAQILQSELARLQNPELQGRRPSYRLSQTSQPPKQQLRKTKLRVVIAGIATVTVVIGLLWRSNGGSLTGGRNDAPVVSSKTIETTVVPLWGTDEAIVAELQSAATQFEVELGRSSARGLRPDQWDLQAEEIEKGMNEISAELLIEQQKGVEGVTNDAAGKVTE